MGADVRKIEKKGINGHTFIMFSGYMSPIMNNINILKSISRLKTNIECKK